MAENVQSKFKEIKQRLSKQQKILKTALDDGRLPDEKEVAEFVAISRQMERSGEPGWRAAMDAYMSHLKRFQKTTADGNPQAAGDAFEDLLKCKISCHKEFR
jgi:XXXCH domain-containing protein